MKLDYILSDTTSSATTEALKQAVQKAENDVFSNVLVLVPEPKSIAIERELLDYSRNNAFSNIFVYSFVRLLSRIGGVNAEDVVSKQTCVMILRKIILDNLDRLMCYKKTAKTIGFAEKIYDTIQQFKSSSYSFHDVQNMSNNSTGALKSKLSDIAILFEEYEKLMGDKLFDDCDRLRQLGHLAKTSDFIRNSDVFIVGFDNITPDMSDVLKELAVNCKSITFSCVYFNENRKDKYIQSNELFRKFTGIATKLNYPFNPKFVKSYIRDDFWNIQNYIYSTEEKETKSKGNVAVFELDSKQKEFECMANQILSEIKKGKRFRDIAVILTDFESDAKLVSKTFDDFNIPYFVSKSYDVSNHYLINFVKSSIEVITSQFSANKVLKWLANPMLRYENYSEFENFVKAFGINRAGFLNKSNLELVADSEKQNIENALNLIISFSNEFKEFFSKENKIEFFVSTLEKLMLFVDAEEKIKEIAKFEKENGLDIEAEISEVILDKFKKMNVNLSKFLGEKIVSVNEFLQIYISGFAEEEVNLVPVSVDCVCIQSNTDGLYNIKDLFVAGAVEGHFPVKMTDAGILQDEELDEMLNLSGKAVEPKIRDINAREKFKIYELLLLPSEKLFVSFPTRCNGGMNKPASIIKKLVKLLGIEIQREYKLNDFITKQQAEKQFAKRVGRYFAGDVISQAELNDEYNAIKSCISIGLENAIERMCFDSKEFKINSAKEIFFVGNKTSVSQLETYFSCPYKFFAKYGLRLKEKKDASLSSLDIGTIVHKFAEIFTKKISEFEDLNDDEFAIKVKNILDKSLEELDVKKDKNIAIISFISDEVVRLARYLFLEQKNSSFKNDAKLNEFSFYGNNAVKLQIDQNTVISIEGKIDRIDKFGDYIRIIDYKTGDTEGNLNSIYYGKKIQLVSYLSASEKFGNKKIAGLFYFPIHSEFVKYSQKLANNYKMQGFLLDDIDTIKYMDSTISFEKPESEFVPLKIKTNKECIEKGEFQISYGRNKNFLSENEFENVKNYIDKLSSQAVREILGGNIEPSPIAKITERESSVCGYCELRGFCGKEDAKFGKARRCGGSVDCGTFADLEGE